MGTSLLYHLTLEGWRDCLLLEKGELASGSTWHAAGQITHSTSSYGLASMTRYGTRKYAELEAETGQSVSWHNSGSLRLAYSPDELDWLHYTVSVGRGVGNRMEVIGPSGSPSCIRSTTSTACWARCTRRTTATSIRPAPRWPSWPAPAAGAPP